MTDIVKDFPGVRALKGVQLKVRPGTVHTLMGENGAGKSTLMKCLIGIHPPTSGKIVFDGKEIRFKTTLEALNSGISMIHQELSPVPERSVSEKSRDEARANLDALKARTALAEAKVKSAQLNLNYTTVRAPISGITSMETQSEGSLIAVNAPMTTITQLDPAYVIFSASENEIFKLGSMVEQGLIVNPRQ